MKLLTIPFTDLSDVQPMSPDEFTAWHLSHGIDPAKVVRCWNDDGKKAVVFEVTEGEAQ